MEQLSPPVVRVLKRAISSAAVVIISAYSFVACSATIDFTNNERKQESPYQISAGTKHEIDYTISCPQSGGCESLLQTISVKEFRIDYPSLSQYPGPKNVVGTPVYIDDLLGRHKRNQLIGNVNMPIVSIAKSKNTAVSSKIRQELSDGDIVLLEEFLSETQMRIRAKTPALMYSGYYTHRRGII